MQLTSIYGVNSASVTKLLCTGPGTKWSPGASEDDIGITLPDEYRSRELSPDLPPGGSESDGSEGEREGEGATASCSVGMGMDQEEEEEEEGVGMLLVVSLVVL